MHFVFLILTFLLSLYLNQVEAFIEPPANEAKVINECLERFGGFNEENSLRLQRYKDWSESYEEIPCFTNCYLNKLFNFYNESRGFNEELVVEKFGRPLYNKCREKLTQGYNGCVKAFKGFHCLTRHEDDPFIFIDTIEQVHSDAKEAMKDCLYKFDSFEWIRLKEYGKFPVREPIPCYTKCFLEKLRLYNKRTHKWNLEEMRTLLGVPSPRANTLSCDNLNKRRHRNECIWLYQAFTCYALAE